MQTSHYPVAVMKCLCGLEVRDQVAASRFTRNISGIGIPLGIADCLGEACALPKCGMLLLRSAPGAMVRRVNSTVHNTSAHLAMCRPRFNQPTEMQRASKTHRRWRIEGLHLKPRKPWISSDFPAQVRSKTTRPGAPEGKGGIHNVHGRVLGYVDFRSLRGLSTTSFKISSLGSLSGSIPGESPDCATLMKHFPSSRGSTCRSETGTTCQESKSISSCSGSVESVGLLCNPQVQAPAHESKRR